MCRGLIRNFILFLVVADDGIDVYKWRAYTNLKLSFIETRLIYVGGRSSLDFFYI